MIPRSLIDGKKVLVVATGPSVFYNMDKIKSYIAKNKPIIVAINGFVHGIRDLQGKIYDIEIMGKKKKIDITSIDDLVPDILFSFLKCTGWNRPSDGQKTKRKCHDLFTPFIEKHRNFFVQNNIKLLYPGKQSRKISNGGFGVPSWEKTCYEFDSYPKGFRRGKRYPLNPKKMFIDDRVNFKVEHGGEYVLAWLLSCKPKSFATCGLLDFPVKKIKVLRRGWFWVDKKRKMPPKMSRHQSVIFKLIKKRFGKSFSDLNIDPWPV